MQLYLESGSPVGMLQGETDNTCSCHPRGQRTGRFDSSVLSVSMHAARLLYLMSVAYLSVFTTGKIPMFNDADFDNRRAAIAPVKSHKQQTDNWTMPHCTSIGYSSITLYLYVLECCCWCWTDLLNLFGMESILVWVAILLKKRIMIYSPDLTTLLLIVRCCPCLGSWHRQNFDLLRPYNTLSPLEISELQSAGVYVCGVTQPQAVNRTELYDIWADGRTQ